MAFPFTINGHTYTKDGVTTGAYAFDGYGWITALGNLCLDVVAVASSASTSSTSSATSATAAATSATAAAASATTAALQAAGLTSTSVTTLTPAVASKTFTTQTSKSYVAGQWVTATSAGNAAIWMFGQVTSYSGTTLIVDVQVIGTASSASDWNLSIASVRGLTGATGAAGATFTGGTLTSAINDAPTVTIASASTVNIGAAAANAIIISGTTTITAFDTIADGALRFITFSGALTLTHNASSLILPGGANITTVAGDTAIFKSLGSGNWRCMDYAKTSVTGSGSAVLATGSTLVSAIINKFTFTAPSTAATINTRADNLTHSLPDASGNLALEMLQQNSKSAAYTTVLADANKHILHPAADTTARTFTIDSNANVAYPIGTALTIVNQNAGGVITISITSDTMRLAGAGTTGNRTLAANGMATALKITSTEWIISGVGLT